MGEFQQFLSSPLEARAKWLPALGLIFVISFCGLPLAAAPINLTFDGGGEADRQVINDEYESLYGLTISADGNSGSSPDVAVIYDSAAPVGADPDLEYEAINGYAGGGNRQFTAYENLLIIQENGTVVGDFVDVAADDDGNGGTITFSFNTATHDAVDSVEFTWVDIDPLTGGNYRIEFIDNDSVLSATVNFSQFVTPAAFWYDATVVFGDHTANQLPVINAADLFLHADIAPASPMTKFDEMIITMESGGAEGSSGSIGEINFTTVPEPTVPILLGVWSFLHILARRRGGV